MLRSVIDDKTSWKLAGRLHPSVGFCCFCLARLEQDAVDLKKVQAEYAFVVQGLQSSNAETQALHAKGQ